MLWKLFSLSPDELTPLERTLLRLAFIVGIFVFWMSLKDIRTYAGVDLRNRVVGARVMLTGLDPYTFRWQPGMPEELLDPVYNSKAHRLTISPPTLLLYACIAPLHYSTQRLISFIAEWLAMIVSLTLLARSLPAQRQRVIFLLMATLFVLSTDIWRLHLERGQAYVFNLLALSVAIAYSSRGTVDSIPAGVAFGVLALLRPNLAVIAPALFLMGQRRSSAAMTAVIAAGLTLTFLMAPLSCWRSYLHVGEQYYQTIQDPDSMPDLPRPLHTGPVEGVEFTHTLPSGDDVSISLPNIESSSFALLYQNLLAPNLPKAVPPLDLALASKVIMAGIAGLLLVLLWRRGDRLPHTAFSLIMVLSLDTEFFLPHRWGYADVMLLAPLALLLPELLRRERAELQLLGVVVLWLIYGPLGQQFVSLYAATVLRSWFVMGGLTLLTLTLWFHPEEENPARP